MVPAVDSAPLVSLAWLSFQRLDRRVGRAVDLIVAEVERARSISHCRTLVDAAGDLLDQCRRALDELADDEREDAADHHEPGQQHHRHRGAAGNAAAVQEVDAGQQHRRQHRRQRHRHDDQLEPRDHPQQCDDSAPKITSSRHDHAAALRTSGVHRLVRRSREAAGIPIA